MTQQEFESTLWRKGMRARIQVHTFTCGIVDRVCVITGVEFEIGRITLRNEDTARPYHRQFDEIELLDDHATANT